MKLLESEHPLESPVFMGTDEEKINALTYWSEMVRSLRSINANVIEYNNKVAILDCLKKELELVTLEITNATAKPTVDPVTGSTAMNNDASPEEAPKVVDLTDPESMMGEMTIADKMRVLSGTKFVGKNTYFPTRNVIQPTIDDLKILAGVKK